MKSHAHPLVTLVLALDFAFVLAPALALGLALGGANTAAAQIPLRPASEPAATPSPSPTSETIAELRSGLTAESEALQRERATAPESLHALLDAQLASLERLELIYAQQLAALQEIADASAERAEVEALRDQVRRGGLSETEPYALTALDTLRDEIDAERQRKTTLRAAVETAEAALGLARKVHEQQERVRRDRRDRAKASDGDLAEQAVRIQELRSAELESRVTEALVALRDLEVQRERAVDATHESVLALANERLARMAPTVTFTEEDLAQQLENLAERERELTARLERAGKALEKAEAQWLADKERLELATHRDPVMSERVEARRREYVTAKQETVIVRERLQRIPALRQIWQIRFALATGATTQADLRDGARNVAAWTAQYEPEADLQLARLADLRKEALTLNERIAQFALSESGMASLVAQRQAIERLSELYEENLDSLSRVLLLNRRLGEELRAASEARPLSERIGAFAAAARDAWTYEVTTVDDESITAGKLVIVLLLLTLGLRIARVLSRAVGERLLPRLGVHPSAANALQTVFYYAAIVAVVLFALRSVNIPLTAFTIVGGALAIGIGFGSQNIVNNFISGLILLAERPISVGDMVEIDGGLGTVERIGPRSTRVRTFDNTHVIIPNSYFLENRFVNWTLSDDVARGRVAVGVAYGTPTRRVETLLIEAARGVDALQPWPEPWVRFTEFGSDALNFELMFYVRPLLQKWAVESEVRHRIAESFAREGISIAFPQRDIHIDATQPLPIRLVDARAGGSKES